jgi:hypothetical protein
LDLLWLSNLLVASSCQYLPGLVVVINTYRFYQKPPNYIVAMQTASNSHTQSVVVDLDHLHCDKFAVLASRF